MGPLNGLPDGVIVTPLRIIDRELGNIMHAMKTADEGFAGFGEAYFTFVKYKAIKGWKKHRQMTLNLVVPAGAVRFVLLDDRETTTGHAHFEIELSLSNYKRLTVPPGIWFAFQGIGEQENMILNLASIRHDPDETLERELSDPFFSYQNWLT
jgi:dTDP-4-dehydrorhamnose 3,5-epimerase